MQNRLLAALVPAVATGHHAPMPHRGLLLLIGALLLPFLAHAQSPTTQPAAQTLLITLGPGQEIYEKFSHNAIWIHDSSQYYPDVAFNYGLFSFGGDFIPRFAFGTMRYWMAGEEALEMLEAYKIDHRSIWIQKLNLNEERTKSLSHFLWRNAEPENRYYTYNYYTDNCSTRVRDALDIAVAGEIRQQTQSRPTGRTYRFHTLRILAENPFLYIGVDFLLGQPGDRDLSEWEEMFLPGYMMQHLRHVTLTGGTALIASEQTYARSDRPPVRMLPPEWTNRFLLAGLFIALALLLSERMSAYKAARVARACLLAFWLALTSIAGLILVFMTYFTDHWAVRGNENIYQMSPIALVALVLLPWALRRREGLPRHPRIVRITAAICVILLGLSIQGLVLKSLPGYIQENWRIIALCLPAHAAAAMIILHAAATKLPAAHPNSENT